MDALLDLRRPHRRTWFARWQLPVLLLTLAIVTVLLVTAPELLGAPTAVGVALVLLASVLAARVPAGGLLAVVVLDLLAVGLIRADTGLTAVGAVALVPLLCLGSHFGRWGVVGAVAGATYVTGLPYVRDAGLPADGPSWVAVLALPVAAVAIALIGHTAGTALRRQQAVLSRQADELSRSLHVSNRQLEIGREILESLPVGLTYYDAQGRARATNRQASEFARLAGSDPEDPGSPGTAVWHEDRLHRVPPAEQFAARALAGDEIEAELVWLGEPGDQVAVAVSVHQVRSYDGARRGTVVVSRDVTELVESVRVRDQFLATLSHELRTPLVSVVGYLDIIAEELSDPDPEIVQMLDTARRGARTLTDRISHLLVAGSRDGLTVDLDRVDLRALVAAVADRYRPAAETRGVQLRCDLADVVTTADPHQVELVVDNLVSNAVKHTAAGGTVEIGLRVRDLIELRVADTGPGLARHERDRAFDRFYRTESARRDALQGLGLGLSICRAVVEAHGGGIDLASSPGTGTTVTVQLPPRAG